MTIEQQIQQAIEERIDSLSLFANSLNGTSKIDFKKGTDEASGIFLPLLLKCIEQRDHWRHIYWDEVVPDDIKLDENQELLKLLGEG